MVQRLHYRRRHTFNTKSNMRRIVRTPGAILTLHHVKKRGTLPRCAQCKEELKGIQPSRPQERKRMSKRLKTVNRAYGGSRCASCVKSNIIRAFINQEAALMRKIKRLADM
ncbi:hypothetical protein GJ496_003011 [Pomphorhynchus laevis]|nr:hypothetical protein GJ496_003011 [Pomphorhynchus laevis]